MGCPAHTVTQHGSGAALIEKPELAGQIISAVQSAISDYSTQKRNLTDLHLKEKVLQIINHNNAYSKNKNTLRPTLSVKTRLGVTSSVVDRWIPFLCQHQLDLLSLHGRTLKQGYGGQADWSEIQKAALLARQANIPLLGNGDIQNRQQGIDHCQKYGTSGFLIGRACLGNPWVFRDQPYQPSVKEKFDTMLLHAQIARQLFPSRRFDYLRQQFLFYAAGHPRAKQLRSSLIRISTLDQLCALEPDFLDC